MRAPSDEVDLSSAASSRAAKKLLLRQQLQQQQQAQRRTAETESKTTPMSAELGEATEAVTVTDRLTEQMLHDFLHTGRICAIVVRNYAGSAAMCEDLAQYFRNHAKLQRYDHEEFDPQCAELKYTYYGVDRVGFPFNKLFSAALAAKQPNATLSEQDVSEMREEYYRSASRSIRSVRRVCAPALSPIDRLRLELDETNPAGATVGAFEQRKMLCGIGRVMTAHGSKMGSAAQPHYDSLPAEISHLANQFSANIYLSTPNYTDEVAAAGTSNGDSDSPWSVSGRRAIPAALQAAMPDTARDHGELEMWDVPALPPHEIHETAPDFDWRAALPPSLLIRPRVGDLILINTRKPHAIRSFQSGDRISLQTFIGLHTDGRLSLFN
jgi:hypothetical protein